LTRHKIFTLLPLLTALALTACGSHPRLPDMVPRTVECAPYARSLTGLALTGPAYDWWDESSGLYRRSQQPMVGSVLVFQRNSRLPDGHVSVVTKLLSSREILVDHANWVHGMISDGDLIRDVSQNNDWTLVRVWWPPTQGLGITIYPAYGFVGPAGASLTWQGLNTIRSLQPASARAICAASSYDWAVPQTGKPS
jgi:hypothetical protein